MVQTDLTTDTRFESNDHFRKIYPFSIARITVASEAHQLMDGSFFGEAADKFAGNSFGELPLSLIPIDSPISYLDVFLNDDDLMPYLGT